MDWVSFEFAWQENSNKGKPKCVRCDPDEFLRRMFSISDAWCNLLSMVIAVNGFNTFIVYRNFRRHFVLNWSMIAKVVGESTLDSLIVNHWPIIFHIHRLSLLERIENKRLWTLQSMAEPVRAPFTLRGKNCICASFNVWFQLWNYQTIRLWGKSKVIGQPFWTFPKVPWFYTHFSHKYNL